MSAMPDSWTAADYLDWESTTDMRHEWIDGQIVAMAGASRAHNLITTNLTTIFNTQLRERPCEVYSGDMRVQAAASVTTGPISAGSTPSTRIWRPRYRFRHSVVRCRWRRCMPKCDSAWRRGAACRTRWRVCLLFLITAMSKMLYTDSNIDYWNSGYGPHRSPTSHHS